MTFFLTSFNLFKGLGQMPRQESQTLHGLIAKYDLGYSKYLSDLDNLYSFTLRSMDHYKIEMVNEDQRLFQTHVAQLIKVVRAATTNADEFAAEMHRYADVFGDCSKELKFSRKRCKKIRQLFTTAAFF